MLFNSIQLPIRLPIVQSRKVWKPGDLCLELSDHSEIFRASLLVRCLPNCKATRLFKIPTSRTSRLCGILAFHSSPAVMSSFRFVVTPSKLRMLYDPVMWTEIISLVGRWMMFNFHFFVEHPHSAPNFASFLTMSVLRILGVFRLLRLGRHYRWYFLVLLFCLWVLFVAPPFQ